MTVSNNLHLRRLAGAALALVLAAAALRDAARRKKKLIDRELVLRVSEALARFE